MLMTHEVSFFKDRKIETDHTNISRLMNMNCDWKKLNLIYHISKQCYSCRNDLILEFILSWHIVRRLVSNLALLCVYER